MTDTPSTLDGLDDLEALLGDPRDPGNVLGYEAVLAADERGELLAEGERLLAEQGLNAEFVPRALGGRFDRADGFAHRMRTVFRRDCTLGIGYGVTSFIAAAPVWTSGDAAQQRYLADLLLRGQRAAAGYTELAHGADFSRMTLSARPANDTLVLSGGKQLVNNVTRAEALLLFARTDHQPGSRSHSHVLVDMTAVSPQRFGYLPRFHTAGVRGCLLAGVEFHGCPVPADGMVGELGGAMETVLRAFQVTRTVLPGMVIGALDTQLRTVLRFALDRRIYDRAVTELPHARSLLVDTFVDLLICDSLATVVARALHLLPGQTSGYAAAVKYLVPKLLADAVYRLSVLLGARSYLREGPYAIFQKNLRDLPVVTLAHASSAVCQATIIPQLPGLARRSWLIAAPPVAQLFRPADPLPALEFGRLALTARGEDNLMAVLAAVREEPAVAEEPLLGRLCDRFVAALAELKQQCGALSPRDRTVIAGRRSFDLAERYAVLVAASACLGVWCHHRDDPFLAGTAWITSALHRLAGRLGADLGPPPERIGGPLYAELLTRHEQARSFDLVCRQLAG